MSVVYQNQVTVGGRQITLSPAERYLLFGRDSIEKNVVVDGDPNLFELMLDRRSLQGSDRIDGWLETLRWYPRDHFKSDRVILDDGKTVLEVAGALLEIYPQLRKQIETCYLFVNDLPRVGWTLEQALIVQKISKLETISADEISKVAPIGITDVGRLHETL